MYSTGGGPPLIERCGGLSCMPGQLGPFEKLRELWRLRRRLRVLILIATLHLIEQRKRPEQQWVRKWRKAALVPS